MERAALQKYGEQLDAETDGRWVVDGLAPAIASLGGSGLVIIDAIRIPAQLEALRQAFGRDVLHVHLLAPPEVLDARYQDRYGAVDASNSRARRAPVSRIRVSDPGCRSETPSQSRS